MSIVLYDLAGRDPALRFSPRCWRTKFALAHKRLEFHTVPWRFHEGALLPQPNERRVPVIEDEGRVVFDSWRIAVYLEDVYSDRPSLFGGERGRAYARFVSEWTDAILTPAILPMIAVDLFESIDPADQAYFRKSRETRLGKSLETAQHGREHRLGSFHGVFAPILGALSDQPWLGGDSPSYSDHVVAAALMWPTRVSRFDLLPSDAQLHSWWDRMLKLYDGLAEKSVRV